MVLPPEAIPRRLCQCWVIMGSSEVYFLSEVSFHRSADPCLLSIAKTCPVAWIATETSSASTVRSWAAAGPYRKIEAAPQGCLCEERKAPELGSGNPPIIDLSESRQWDLQLLLSSIEYLLGRSHEGFFAGERPNFWRQSFEVFRDRIKRGSQQLREFEPIHPGKVRHVQYLILWNKSWDLAEFVQPKYWRWSEWLLEFKHDSWYA